jgi:hypothetical protein
MVVEDAYSLVEVDFQLVGDPISPVGAGHVVVGLERSLLGDDVTLVGPRSSLVE